MSGWVGECVGWVGCLGGRVDGWMGDIQAILVQDRGPTHPEFNSLLFAMDSVWMAVVAVMVVLAAACQAIQAARAAEAAARQAETAAAAAAASATRAAFSAAATHPPRSESTARGRACIHTPPGGDDMPPQHKPPPAGLAPAAPAAPLAPRHKPPPPVLALAAPLLPPPQQQQCPAAPSNAAVAPAPARSSHKAPPRSGYKAPPACIMSLPKFIARAERAD